MTNSEPYDAQKANEIADRVDGIVHGSRRLEGAAFDLLHQYYPDCSPDRQMLASVAYLLYTHGAETVSDWVIQTAYRRIEFDKVVNYLYGIRRRVLEGDKYKSPPPPPSGQQQNIPNW